MRFDALLPLATSAPRHNYNCYIIAYTAVARQTVESYAHHTHTHTHTHNRQN